MTVRCDTPPLTNDVTSGQLVRIQGYADDLERTRKLRAVAKADSTARQHHLDDITVLGALRRTSSELWRQGRGLSRWVGKQWVLVAKAALEDSVYHVNLVLCTSKLEAIPHADRTASAAGPLKEVMSQVREAWQSTMEWIKQTWCEDCCYVISIDYLRQHSICISKVRFAEQLATRRAHARETVASVSGLTVDVPGDPHSDEVPGDSHSEEPGKGDELTTVDTRLTSPSSGPAGSSLEPTPSTPVGMYGDLDQFTDIHQVSSAPSHPRRLFSFEAT